MASRFQRGAANHDVGGSEVKSHTIRLMPESTGTSATFLPPSSCVPENRRTVRPFESMMSIDAGPFVPALIKYEIGRPPAGPASPVNALGPPLLVPVAS